jgi:hypothetical protein
MLQIKTQLLHFGKFNCHLARLNGGNFVSGWPHPDTNGNPAWLLLSSRHAL